MKKNIEFIRDNYGSDFVLPLIVSKDYKHVDRVLKYLDGYGERDVVLDSPSILALTMDEIIERRSYIESCGLENVCDGRFNSIYGLSRKKYIERVNALGKGIKR